mgnify:CR=1 FL=1
MKVKQCQNLVSTQEIADAIGIKENSIRKTYVGNENKSDMLKTLGLGTICKREGVEAKDIVAISKMMKSIKEDDTENLEELD